MVNQVILQETAENLRNMTIGEMNMIQEDIHQKEDMKKEDSISIMRELKEADIEVQVDQIGEVIGMNIVEAKAEAEEEGAVIAAEVEAKVEAGTEDIMKEGTAETAEKKEANPKTEVKMRVNIIIR